jgi:hypothetical protein
MDVTQEVKIELLYDPAISLLGMYPKEMKLVCQTDTSHVHCSTIYNS